MQSVAIFGVPRSGTSWLGQIFNSSPKVAYRFQPIFAYSFQSGLSENSTKKDIHDFHQNLLSIDDDFVCQKKNVSGNLAPVFEKDEITHLVWKEVRYLNIIENLLKQSSTKVIGIMRHPCGVIKSWMKAPREFDTNWDIQKEWRFADKKNNGSHEFYGFERWLIAAEMFMDFEIKYSGQFKTVLYEVLLKDPEPEIEALFNFVNLEVDEQTYSFLKRSMDTPSSEPYDVFRKNKSGREWKEELPNDIIERINGNTRFKKILEELEGLAEAVGT